MCGRYELHAHPAAIALAFGLDVVPPLAPRYNIAPMQDVPVVRVNAAGARELAMVRWGLVPRWAKDASIGAKMINARGETLKEKPAFRTAYRRHRCLVPADGFYEWQFGPDGKSKRPMRIAMADGATFAFAGLAERWLAPDGEPLDTCTIVTTEANGLIRALHERMPVIVPPAAYARWLDPATGDPADLVASYPAGAMRFHPVSTRVNAVRNDDASLIEPLPAPAEAPPAEPELALDSPPPPRKPRQSALF